MIDPARSSRRRLVAALVFMAIAAPVAAKPPIAGSDDYEIMRDFSDWVQAQRDSEGHWCCNIADGRPVAARKQGDHWQVWIGRKQFDGAPDAWVNVPESARLRDADGRPVHNPVGVPIAWWRDRRVLCFVEASGI
jgi:hypothetical protein